jgi:hypothetical protein
VLLKRRKLWIELSLQPWVAVRTLGQPGTPIPGQKRKLPRYMSGRLGSFGSSSGPGKISSVSENE